MRVNLSALLTLLAVSASVMAIAQDSPRGTQATVVKPPAQVTTELKVLAGIVGDDGTVRFLARVRVQIVKGMCPDTADGPGAGLIAEGETSLRGEVRLELPTGSYWLCAADTTSPRRYRWNLALEANGKTVTIELSDSNAVATATPAPPKSSDTPPVETRVGYVLCSYVDVTHHLYDSADGIRGKVIQPLPCGEAVTVLEERSDGWKRIRTQQGREGYVSGVFITGLVPSTPASPGLPSAQAAHTDPRAAQDSFRSDYPASQRIQIPEACSLVAKWLTQALTGGTHWQMLRYEPDLGVLTFKVVQMESLTKAEASRYIDGVSKVKNVHVDQAVFTLRSLVASSLSFDNAQHSTANTCTIAAAFKFVGKDGNALGSSGKMETDLLQTIKARYAEHGLDY